MAKTKVLVISSDPLLVRFAQKLSRTSFQITVRRETGEELRATLDEELPDVILLDIMMPGLDGVEVCLRIRQWRLTPIMMLSSWGAGENRIRGLNLGADGYLTEPFGIEELSSRIKKVLLRNYTASRLPSASQASAS